MKIETGKFYWYLRPSHLGTHELEEVQCTSMELCDTLDDGDIKCIFKGNFTISIKAYYNSKSETFSHRNMTDSEKTAKLMLIEYTEKNIQYLQSIIQKEKKKIEQLKQETQ
ncbi:MAG: hypothetical protein LBE56_12295 [Tannerella sp.]|jgi:hypothetical protein|nr:hypothetical protein [Tannerella sp.]